MRVKPYSNISNDALSGTLGTTAAQAISPHSPAAATSNSPTGPVTTLYHNPKNQLTSATQVSPNGTQKDYYDPQSGQLTNQVVNRPDGGHEVYSYDVQGKLGSHDSFNPDGKIATTAGYNPNEHTGAGAGTFTYGVHDPDGSTLLDKYSTSQPGIPSATTTRNAQQPPASIAANALRGETGIPKNNAATGTYGLPSETGNPGDKASAENTLRNAAGNRNMLANAEDALRGETEIPKNNVATGAYGLPGETGNPGDKANVENALRNAAGTLQNNAAQSATPPSNNQTGPVTTLYHNPKNQLTSATQVSPNGTQKDYYDPQSGQLTNQVVNRPDGGHEVYSYDAQGKLGSHDSFNPNGKIATTAGYNPNEHTGAGAGTFTYGVHDPDGSTLLDKYSTNPPGTPSSTASGSPAADNNGQPSATGANESPASPATDSSSDTSAASSSVPSDNNDDQQSASSAESPAADTDWTSSETQDS